MKHKDTKQVLCPHCTEKKGKYPSMLCAEDNGDIIIRCRTCKTDVNVSKLLREQKAKDHEMDKGSL